METLTLTYELTPDETSGFTVQCKDWGAVFSEGETINECKENAIEVTEMFLTDLKEGALHKSQYPNIKRHTAKPLQFLLTFNYDTGKNVSIEKLSTLKKFHRTKLKTKIPVEI